MAEEIDLRPYIEVLLKYKYWIGGLAIMAAVLAFIVTSLIPPKYQATTLIIASKPRYELEFDTRSQNNLNTAIEILVQTQYRTYPVLATSGQLLQQLADEVDQPVAELQKNLVAELQTRTNLLALQVTGPEPVTAAAVANRWAELFIEKTNALYGNSAELEEYREQQQSITQTLAEADAALVRFRAENGFGFQGNGNADLGLMGRRLAGRNNLLADYETELVRLKQMGREIELLAQTTTSDTAPVVTAGLLAEMINHGVVDEAQPGQIRLEALEPATALAALDQAIQARISAVETEMEPLRTEITTLQAELAARQQTLEQLVRDRNVKAEAYGLIARKVQEVQMNSGEVRLASAAAATVEALPRDRLRNTAIAGVLALMAGAFGAFAIEWWRNE